MTTLDSRGRPRGGPNASLRVEEYFSQEAARYEARSDRFPWTWARAREGKAVGSLLGDIAGADVLELGAGSGYYTRELIRRGARHVWAVDVSRAMLDAIPSGPVTLIHGSAETVRLDRRFHVLLSAGMLEFVQDPAGALANAARHADTGARFILLVPRRSVAGWVYRRFHAAHGVRVRLFDSTWFTNAAAESHWRVGAVVPLMPFSLAVSLTRR